MPHPSEPSFSALLWITAALLVAGNSLTLAQRMRARRRTGRPIVIVQRRRRVRLVLLVGVAVAGLLVVLGAEPQPIAPALTVLGLAAAFLAIAPGFADSVFGEEGVQVGWHARSFADLDAWRLTGDHLRWQLRGQWVGSDVPAKFHADLRAKLEGLCPERESRFNQ